MYQIDSLLMPEGTTSSQAPIEVMSEISYNKKDLTKFFKDLNMKEATIEKTYGPFNGEGDIEATLDTQYLLGVSDGAVNMYYTSESWMYTMTNNFYKILTSEY